MRANGLVIVLCRCILNTFNGHRTREGNVVVENTQLWMARLKGLRQLLDITTERLGGRHRPDQFKKAAKLAC